MENSPLIFLDRDVSLMLAEQVKVSQKDYTRKYHLNLYQCRPRGFPGLRGGRTVHYYHGIICLVLKRLARTRFDLWERRLWGAILPGRAKPRIILYEKELKNIREIYPKNKVTLFPSMCTCNYDL